MIFMVSLTVVNFILTRFALLPLRQPTTLVFWTIKVFVSALSPLLFLIALLTVILGWTTNSMIAVVLGSLSGLFYLLHIFEITRAPFPPTGFENVLGEGWENWIPPQTKDRFLRRRYAVLLPPAPEPVLQQDVSFYTIPGTNRQLFADIWQPPDSISRSGLAFVYLHGSAWTVLDKDFGTRPLFRHLTSQGHLIMDVAYRLFPETGFTGMVHDALHAVAWLKSHAATYLLQPGLIVIGGGSAGAHIALLAAYAQKSRSFTPDDLNTADLSVRAVVSLYGQADLAATFYHTAQHLSTRSAIAQKQKDQSGGMPSWIQKSMGTKFHRLGFDKDVQPGMLEPMLSGTPETNPEAYRHFSPLSYVHPGSPPTLLVQGNHDILAPLKALQQLQSRLSKAGVPVVMHTLTQTDHAFDLIFPRISPSAHNAIYDVERFLAVMVEWDSGEKM